MLNNFIRSFLLKTHKILLRNKKHTELARKFIHISSIVLPLSYRYLFNYNKRMTLIVFVSLGVLSVIIELLRQESKGFRKYFRLFFGLMLRQHEVNNLTGASYLLTSAIFSVAFFPPDIAFAAMAFLSIGDTAAALVGMNLGKRKFLNSNKTVEGTLACFVTTFIFGLFIFVEDPIIALFGAVSVCVAETINLKIDDNIKIPIISGIVMCIVWLFT